MIFNKILYRLLLYLRGTYFKDVFYYNITSSNQYGTTNKFQTINIKILFFYKMSQFVSISRFPKTCTSALHQFLPTIEKEKKIFKMTSGMHQ